MRSFLGKLTNRLDTRFQGLIVAGSYPPLFRPLTATEEDETAARINAANPDIVWVGIGTPKQDYWVARFRDRLAASVLIPVGAAFNFHAGAVRQAPRWMQKAGLNGCSGFSWNRVVSGNGI